jgi:phytoene/squalene synthetase
MTAESITTTQGFDTARQLFMSRFGAYRWLLGGLSEDKRCDIYVILQFLAKALELLDEEPHGLAPGAHWEKLRDELRRASGGSGQESWSIALLDVVDRNQIAKQWIFEVLDGIDLWARFRTFPTADYLRQFACKIGGGTMNMLVPIVDVDRPHFESHASEAGKAIALNHILLGLSHDLRRNRNLLPRDMLDQFAVEPTRVDSPEAQSSFCRLIRTLASQIELDFFEAAPLIGYLSFDGQRVMKSLLGLHWELLTRIKENPLTLLEHTLALTRRELAKLKMKHLLGIEGSGVPFVVAGTPHGAHHGH